MKDKRTQTDRDYDLQNTLRDRLVGLYHRAQTYHLTSDRLQELAVDQVWTPAADLPVYRRQYLHGYRDALDARLWYEWCEWRLGPVKGPVRTIGDPWTPEVSDLCRQPGKLHGGHFWKGTDKPFTPYAVSNGPTYGYAPAGRPPRE